MTNLTFKKNHDFLPPFAIAEFLESSLSSRPVVHLDINTRCIWLSFNLVIVATHGPHVGGGQFKW